MNKRSTIFIVLLAFLAGFIGGQVGSASAHGGNTLLVHGCVRNLDGLVKIVSATKNCPAGFFSLHWGITGPQGPQGLPGQGGIDLCPNCDFSYGYFSGLDLSGAFYQGATFLQATLIGTKFNNANLISVNFQQADLTGADFSGANMSYVSAPLANFSGANLTNVNFTGANLGFAANMDTTIRTGVVWLTTVCPDGTNSSDHGETCEGHLTP